MSKPRIKYTREGVHVLRNFTARVSYGWEAMLVPPVNFLPNPKDGLYSFKEENLPGVSAGHMVWVYYLCIEGQWYKGGLVPFSLCNDWPRLSEKEVKSLRVSYRWITNEWKYILDRYDYMSGLHKITREAKLYRRRYKKESNQ